MGDGVVLWPVFPSHGDDRSTFFFLDWNFPFWDFLGTNYFLAETLFKYTKYSFFFGVDFSFHGSSLSLGIWSTPPVSYFEGKKSCFTQLRRCLKQKYKKGRLFLLRWEYFLSKRNVKNRIKLADNSWENFATVRADRRLSISSGRDSRLPASEPVWQAHPSSRANISPLWLAHLAGSTRSSLDKDNVREHCWLGKSRQFFLINTP